MKAFEVMGTLNNHKQLLLDDSVDVATPSRVKVILLISEEDKSNADDTLLTFFQNEENIVEILPNGVKLEMVYIPAGSFMMGANQGEEGASKDEFPQHQVTLKAFWMAKYPITQAQYQAIMGVNMSRFKNNNNPVEKVSWNNAQEFCQKLSQMTGKQYQLPSEAQWEYACRAGTTTPFYFGETLSDELANYDATYAYGNGKKGKYRQQTTPVGTFPPNAFGLYDMHGNVWEWCADSWHENYNNAPTDGSAWIDLSSHLRVLRGGSWDDKPRYCRSADRQDDAHDNNNLVIGFRVVLCEG